MIDLSRVEKYYVACGYTDMRRGIDGLGGHTLQAAQLAGQGGDGVRRCVHRHADDVHAPGVVGQAFISSILCRTAKNTVFVRTVCGLLVKSVEPEDTSLTHTNAVELCMRASASSKPSKLLTRQNLKFFDRASLLLSVSRRKKSAASQLNDLLSILFL